VIQIPRKILGQFRTVVRKLGSGSLDAHSVLMNADGDGLRLRAMVPGVALEYRQPGDFGAGAMSFRAEILKTCQGTRDDPITFSTTSDKKGVAEWLDGIPQRLAFDLIEEKEEFPAPPPKLHNAPESFAEALRQALPCCARQQGERYATHCVLLDGAGKRLAATDGRQLLVVTGLAFPWKDEILLPALPAFALKDLLQERMQIGKTDTQVTLVAGPWSFHCSVAAGGRYPRVDQILPKLKDQTTTLTIDPGEVSFLLHTLPRLPRPEDDAERITLDMDQEIIVRANGQSEQTTDVVLTRSKHEGKKLRLCVGRGLFGQALEIGIERFSFSDADKPVLGQGENRTYVWLPLSPKLAVAASADCRRIEAVDGSAPPAGKPRRDPVVVHSNGNGNAQALVNDKENGSVAVSENGADHASASVPARKKRSGKSAAAVSILETSQKLREQARALAHGLNDMIKTIKAQRRQNRLVETTLSSLRQLKGLAV
jgi:hypothetical protein